MFIHRKEMKVRKESQVCRLWNRKIMALVSRDPQLFITFVQRPQLSGRRFGMTLRIPWDRSPSFRDGRCDTSIRNLETFGIAENLEYSYLLSFRFSDS